MEFSVGPKLLGQIWLTWHENTQNLTSFEIGNGLITSNRFWGIPEKLSKDELWANLRWECKYLILVNNFFTFHLRMFAWKSNRFKVSNPPLRLTWGDAISPRSLTKNAPINSNTFDVPNNDIHYHLQIQYLRTLPQGDSLKRSGDIFFRASNERPQGFFIVRRKVTQLARKLKKPLCTLAVTEIPNKRQDMGHLRMAPFIFTWPGQRTVSFSEIYWGFCRIYNV